MGGNQKVVGFDDIDGIPFESREIQLKRPPIKLLSRLNEIKLLTAVSEAGLLSGAEEAGVFSKLEGAGAFSLIEKTLPLVEKLGLLSTAEKLGALSLLEKLSMMDGATVASFGIPFFVAAIAVVSLVPDDTTLQVVGQYSAAGLFLGIFGALFIGGNILKGLQLDYYSKN